MQRRAAFGFDGLRIQQRLPRANAAVSPVSQTEAAYLWTEAMSRLMLLAACLIRSISVL